MATVPDRIVTTLKRRIVRGALQPVSGPAHARVHVRGQPRLGPGGAAAADRRGFRDGGIATSVPLIRIGFDARAILDTLASWVDLLRAGQRSPASRKVNAVSEEAYRRQSDTSKVSQCAD